MARVAHASPGQLMALDAEVANAARDFDDVHDFDGPDAGGDEPPAAAVSGDDLSVGSGTEVTAATVATSAMRMAIIAGICIVVALAALLGWLTVRAHQATALQDQRELFVDTGKQGAINLTTIDWQHADADVQRILDDATGSFRDDFAKQAQPFIELVKQSKSVTSGTVTDAGVETETDNDAQILVIVAVKTSNAAAPQQDSRSWRMRIGVQKVGQDVKVSNVEFVP